MENGKQHFCRLCLNFVNEKTFTVIENVVNDILNFLLLKLNFDDISNRSVCNDCSKKLYAAFEFKSKCVDKDDLVMTYVEVQADELPLDIMEIYQNEMEKKGLNIKLENNEVCRLCLKLVPDEFVSVSEVDDDVIRSFIPGMDFDVTRNPVVCRECFDSLHDHNTFLNSCRDAQVKIKSIVQPEDIEELPVEPLSVCVKSEALEIKSSQGESEMMILDELEQPQGTPSFLDGFQLKCKQESLTSDLILKDDALSSGNHSAFDEESPVTPNFTYIPDDPRNTVKNNVSSLKNVHKCNECDYQTRYKHNLAKHYLRHTDQSEIKFYKCDQCDFQTKYFYGLTSHQQKHKDISEVRSFKCGECDFRTRYKRDLNLHELRHRDESEVIIYECTECEYRSRYKFYLERHILKHRDPSEITMHKCDECDFQTRHKNNLANHRLKHKDASEVRVYKCDVCDFQTKYSQGLSKHLLKHRDQSEVRVHKCPHCDYRTRCKYHLKRHQLVHKDASQLTMYKCDKCGLQTKHERSFMRHQLRHADNSEVEMFKCDECDFQTKHKRYLSNHQVKHKAESEVKIYKCNQCDFQSRYQRSLAVHRRKKNHKKPDGQVSRERQGGS